MGYLYYDGHRWEMDDRLLAHLQVIVSMKLRRSESFFLSWTKPSDDGSGREAIWIDRGVPLRITYSGNRAPTINREWAEILALAANTNAGLIMNESTFEPGEPRTIEPNDHHH